MYQRAPSWLLQGGAGGDRASGGPVRSVCRLSGCRQWASRVGLLSDGDKDGGSSHGDVLLGMVWAFPGMALGSRR